MIQPQAFNQLSLVDRQQKLRATSKLVCCKICNQPTVNRIRCGVLACEACKKFFQRNRSNGESLRCVSGTYNCSLSDDQAALTSSGTIWRLVCPRCRLVKCLAVGMRILGRKTRAQVGSKNSGDERAGSSKTSAGCIKNRKPSALMFRKADSLSRQLQMNDSSSVSSRNASLVVGSNDGVITTPFTIESILGSVFNPTEAYSFPGDDSNSNTANNINNNKLSSPLLSQQSNVSNSPITGQQPILGNQLQLLRTSMQQQLESSNSTNFSSLSLPFHNELALNTLPAESNSGANLISRILALAQHINRVTQSTNLIQQLPKRAVSTDYNSLLMTLLSQQSRPVQSNWNVIQEAVRQLETVSNNNNNNNQQSALPQLQQQQ